MPSVCSWLLRMRCWTLLLSGLLLLGLAHHRALAQTPSYKVHPDYLVKHFTVEDGLPVNHINDIIQTQDGYLWMTTFDGLVRFDGNRFTVFNTSNSPGLTSNRLYGLHEEPDGTLWIRSEAGDVMCYTEGAFTAFTQEHGLPGAAHTFYQDADTLWVTTSRGVLRHEAGTLQPYRPDLLSEPVATMLRDRAGALWVFGQHTLVRIQPGGQVHRFTVNEGLPGSAEGIFFDEQNAATFGSDLFEDREATLWAGTIGGVARLRGERFEPLLPGAALWHSETPPTIHQDPEGTLWFGTSRNWWAYRQGTLKPFTTRESHFPKMTLMSDPNGNAWRIAGAFWLYRNAQPIYRLNHAQTLYLQAFFYDSEGNLWLSDDGLTRIRPRLIQVLSTAQGLPGPNVYPILEARDGSIWLGTWTISGLTRLQGNTLIRFSLADNHDHRLHDLVSALFEDQGGTLWVGTLGALCRMQGSRCVVPELPVASPFTQAVSALHEDRQGRFWIGSEAGLTVGLPGKNGRTWTAYPLDHSIRAIVETTAGDILLGTTGSGLGRYLHDGQIEWLTTANGLASDHIRDVYEDTNGTLWIATQDRGLCRLDRAGQPMLKAGNLLCLDLDDGLFDNSLHRILEDDYGRLWMSTNRGIFWVEHAELEAFARDEVSSITSVGYTERDGMRNSEANGARQPAGMKASDGRLWFPTQDGAVIVDPSQVQRLEAPPIVIETVTIGNRIERATGTLTLAPGERDLDIGYTALAFSRPEDVRFRYMLEGYDDDWNDVGNRRLATYTNLSPGVYTFRVKAGLGGAWSEEDATLMITRQPFFWETRWFYGLVVLLFIVAGPSIYAYRVRRLKARQEILERIVTERTAQIRAHEAQLEQQADELRRANELKSRFLANISHEFRTPLTLTFGPLNDVLKNRFASLDEARPHLERARRNGHRLLRLINQLLDLSKLDASALTLQADHYDLVAFLRQRLAAFESLAAARNLSFHFVPEAASLPHVFDAEKLETIVLNLLSNAFKFTPAGGSIVVAVRKDDAGQALLTVRDTGIGIAQDHLPYLFDRFYQVDPSTTRAREGTGIGLALVRQLVELHGGRIEAESTLGLGTTFTVTLPLLEAAHGDEPAPGTQPHEAATEAVLADLAEIPRLLDDSVPADGADDAATIILVVEDNADMRAYLRTHLEGLYHIEEAENGAVGFEKARAVVPDLVLSDVMMPEMDGFALLAALKTDPRTSHVPVVLLTAKADARSKIEGLQTGADDYLAKPFDAEELRARVRNLIEQRRRLRAQFSQQGPPLHLPPVALPSMEAAFLERVREAIEAEMAEVSFGVDDLAAAVGMSPRQLRRKLRSLLDATPNSLIRRIRLERAASMLSQETGRVKEVAFAVGFKSTSRFREAFQEIYGVAPSDYAPAQPPPAAGA